ncbi:MAG: nitroreductase family protein [Alphaproteobacteria bacterium]|nr:nitroreductase family protein [Alphaproteobacteria bacterium]
MDAHTALTTRRTVHAWTPAHLPDAVVARALEAAHQAPCHKLTWPWRFTVVGPQTRAVLAEAAVRAKAAGLPAGASLPDAAADGIRRKLLDASGLVVVHRMHVDDPHRAREDYAAVAAAIQNLMVSLHADGWASKWSTGAVTTAPATYAALGIDPEVARIEGFVWIGQPATVPTITRPPVASLVRHLP